MNQSAFIMSQYTLKEASHSLPILSSPILSPILSLASHSLLISMSIATIGYFGTQGDNEIKAINPNIPHTNYDETEVIIYYIPLNTNKINLKHVEPQKQHHHHMNHHLLNYLLNHYSNTFYCKYCFILFYYFIISICYYYNVMCFICF
eukprot:474569_1